MKIYLFIFIVFCNAFAAEINDEINEVYISGKCISARSSNVEYEEGDDQYCGYVIVNHKKMNIIGRAWNCKSLTFERTQNSCASDSRFWLNKSIELNDNIVELCQQTRIEGISINPKDSVRKQHRLSA